MAVQTNLLIHGLNVENAYWRIGTFFYSTNEGIRGFVTVRFDGYANQDAYQNGNQNLVSFEYQLSIADLDIQDLVTEIVTAQDLINLIRTVIYNKAKSELAIFQNSTDV